MANNSAVNLDINNNADGFDISGGSTKRKISVTGSDISLTGSGSNTFTFPSSTDTLVGRTSTDTLTNKTIDADNNTISNLAHGAEVDDPSSGVHGVTGSVVGTTDTQTLTNKTIDGDSNTVQDLPYNAIKSTSRTGNDTKIVTGTTGTSGDLSVWNSDGDLVDGPTPPSGTIVGTTDTQTLTNKTLTAPNISGYGGWQPQAGSWTFGSWSSTYKTGVINISGVTLADYYSVGMRVKLYLPTTADQLYGIITAVGASTITVFFGNDYILLDDALGLSNIYYSTQKAPLGFPLEPSIWIIEVGTDTGYGQTSPGQNTWYNPGDTASQLNLPIGSWMCTYKVVGYADRASAAGCDCQTTLSTSDSSNTITQLLTRAYNADVTRIMETFSPPEYNITVTSETTLYLLIRTTQGSMQSVNFQNANAGMTIYARCAYL